MTVPTWLYVVGVLGTWAIAIFAIWGEKIRSILFRPKLQLAVRNLEGELVPLTSTETGAVVGEARYYHLRVTNSTLFPAANEVQVLITALEIRGPDDRPQRVFTGALPLNWQHSELQPLTRTVGSSTEAIADLAFVRNLPNGLSLNLTPVRTPNNFRANYAGDTHIWVTAVARGTNGESAPLRLQIDWDGGWDRGDKEMTRHLVVKAL